MINVAFIYFRVGRTPEKRQRGLFSSFFCFVLFHFVELFSQYLSNILPSILICILVILLSYRFGRFTNPSATDADLVSLQKEILREVLSYTPGHASFRGSSDPDGGVGKSPADSDADGLVSEGRLGAGKAAANTGTVVMPTSPVPLPARGSRNGGAT